APTQLWRRLNAGDPYPTLPSAQGAAERGRRGGGAGRYRSVIRSWRDTCADPLSSVRTRGDLAEVTGLSRMTVAQRVDALLAARMIRESGSARSSGGRRAAHLEFNVDAATVVTVAAETTHARIALTKLDGEILASQ